MVYNFLVLLIFILIRIYFLGHELEVQQIGKTAEESSYMIGRFNNPDRDITFHLFEKEINNYRTNESNENSQTSFSAINK